MAIAFTCSEDGDFGSLGDNKVIVTGGTAETPADFDDFVTADRAGAATLLDAGTIDADPDTFSLDYAVRPVDLANILLTISASADRAGATMDIVGKDNHNDVVSELGIDISGANSSPVTTIVKFASVDASGITVNGMTNDDTITITQSQWGLVWDFGNSSFYQYDGIEWDIGDDSTTTFFKSTLEAVYLNAGCNGPRVRSAATFDMGEIDNDFGINGSFWSFGPDTLFQLTDNFTSAVNIAASHLHLRTNTPINNRWGDIVIRNAIFSGITDSPGTGSNHFIFNIGHPSSTADIKGLYINRMYDMLMAGVPDPAEDIWVHDCQYGFVSQATGVALANAKWTSIASSIDAWTQPNGTTLEMIDPETNITGPQNNNADSWIQETYTCNIKVVDRDGAALENVIVDCEEADTTAVWTAGTILTDASGDIAEQQIRYKRWSGTSETLTDYSPHVFTISLAGYETQILPAITVDHPLVLHVELKGVTRHKLGSTTYFTDDS